MFKRILVAVDFSDFSQEAVRIASGLTGGDDCHVLVLHVCNAPKAVDPAIMVAQSSAIKSLIELQQEMAKAAGKKLQDWIGRYDWNGASVGSEVLSGAAYKVIANRAREIEADLIVMGSYGRSGFARRLIGSTTEKVLRKTRCPLLAVTIPVLQG